MSTSENRLKTKDETRRELLAGSGFESGRQALESLPWEAMSSQMGNALRALLLGQRMLREAHAEHISHKARAGRARHMTFALDGRLVGDIGELIAAEVFCLDLMGSGSHNVDAITTRGARRKVQVKVTFQPHSLNIKHAGDFLIGMQLDDEGRYRVVYNGPARKVMDYLKAPRARGHEGPKSAGLALVPLSLEAWAVLNLSVKESERIPRRKPIVARRGRR